MVGAGRGWGRGVRRRGRDSGGPPDSFRPGPGVRDKSTRPAPPAPTSVPDPSTGRGDRKSGPTSATRAADPGGGTTAATNRGGRVMTGLRAIGRWAWAAACGASLPACAVDCVLWVRALAWRGPPNVVVDRLPA